MYITWLVLFMFLRKAQETLWIIKISVLSTTEEDALRMICNVFWCTSCILFFVLKFAWYESITALSAGRVQLKCDGTHAQTRFRLSAKRTSPFKLAGWGGASFQSTTGTAEVCASVVVMLDAPCSEVVWRVLATDCIRQFPPFPPLRHRVPSHFNWILLILLRYSDIYGINQPIYFWRLIVISVVLLSSCWGGRSCWRCSTIRTRKSFLPVRVITERRTIFNRAHIDFQWLAFHSSGTHSASLWGGGQFSTFSPENFEITIIIWFF